jgi:hypothetical protein
MDSEKSLEDKILDWLESQGYPLEMRVASSLTKADFWVRQSQYYFDPETNVSREIDVIATKTDILGFLEIDFMIECKTSSKPWLLFTSEETLNNYNRLFAFGVLSNATKKVLADHMFDSRTQELFEERLFSLPWFKKEGRVAYGMTQAFTSGSDVAYKASINTLKAALSRKIEIENERSGQYPLLFAFPVIVVEGQLFECYLNQNASIAVQEVEQSFFHFPTNIVGNVGTCIRVVSAASMQNFCYDASELSERIMDLLKEDIEEIAHHRSSD